MLPLAPSLLASVFLVTRPPLPIRREQEVPVTAGRYACTPAEVNIRAGEPGRLLVARVEE